MVRPMTMRCMSAVTVQDDVCMSWRRRVSDAATMLPAGLAASCSQDDLSALLFGSPG